MMLRRDCRRSGFASVLSAALATAAVAGMAPAPTSAAGGARLDLHGVHVTIDDPAGLPIAAAPDGATVAAWSDDGTGGGTEVRAAWHGVAGAWSAPVVVARSTGEVGLWALRAGPDGGAALAWSDASGLHVALRGGSGTWQDVAIDTPPRDWGVTQADLLALPGGRALVAWTTGVGSGHAGRSVTWMAEVGADGVRRRAALGGGPSSGTVASLGLGADPSGSPWLAVTSSGDYEPNTVGWGRWSSDAGLLTLAAPGSLRAGLGPAAAPPLVDGQGVARLVRRTTSLNNEQQIRVTTLPAAGPTTPVTSRAVPDHGRAPRAARPWVALYGSPTVPSAAIDERGRLVVAAGISAHYAGNNDILILGWEPTSTAWAFTLRANGRGWDRALIDQLAGSPYAPPVVVHRGASGRLTAAWRLSMPSGTRCDDVAFAADQRSDGSWAPRRIIARLTGRRPTVDPTCFWGSAAVAATGGRDPMLAVAGNGRLLVTPVAPRPARAALGPRVGLQTATWAAVRRRGALEVRCASDPGTICGIDSYPVLPEPAPPGREDAEILECFDDRPMRTIGKSGVAVLVFPIDRYCLARVAASVRAVDLHVVADHAGRRPSETVRRVAITAG